MCDRLRLAGGQGDSLVVRLGLERFLALASGVALRHGLPVLRFVVQCLEVQRSVHLPRALTGDRVAEVVLLRSGGGARPIVGAVVRGVGGDEVQTRDLVDWHVPCSGEHLLIGVRRPTLGEAALDRVFPRLVVVVRKAVVADDLRCVVAFVHRGVHCRLERELQVPAQVVLEVEVPAPREVLAEGYIHVVERGIGVEVAHLHLREGTLHSGVERPRLRQVVQVELLDDLHLVHTFHLTERLPRLRVERVGVVELSALFDGLVAFHLRRVLVLLVVRRRDAEVCRVVEHIFLLRVNVHLHVRHAERGALHHGVAHPFDRVAFLLGLVLLEVVAQLDICIQRVVLGRDRLVGVRHV